MRPLPLVLPAACALLLAAATRAQAPVPDPEGLGAELVVARAGCLRCHELPGAPARALPIAGPDLGEGTYWQARDGGSQFLRRHHGGEAAADLAAWVRAVTRDGPWGDAVLPPALPASGARLFGELACGACHDPAALQSLALRTNHAELTAFLVDPSRHRPGLVHDFSLNAGEASALAAWLLRTQADGAPAAATPGFAYECFELPIQDAKEPDLSGLQPKAAGVVAVIDVSPKTRDDEFALRFLATLDVPATGDWTFTTGSDDCSWLWIDGRMVVRNEALAPHRRRSGTVKLTAGPHALQVVYTEARGGESLEVLWRGPGVDEQPIPAERADARMLRLVAPPMWGTTDADAVARGRAAAVQKRCTACHTVADPMLASEPSPRAAPAFAALHGGPCPENPAAAAVFAPAKAAFALPASPAHELAFAMRRDGCTSCHVRDGQGGLVPAVQKGLVETEDLGPEGVMPPDLTHAGARLRQGWIERVLGEHLVARTYLRVRMPRLSAARAKDYAAWFAAVDAADVVDDEPPFAAANADIGHRLAGTQGKNCITCHRFGGHPALGPQGMDLAIQVDRLRPQWFEQWLLRAPILRPGTRMPLFWPLANDADRAEVAAIRSWLALGPAAPLPDGLVAKPGAFDLMPAERPILHGAFLDGLSARCIAVGTPLRTHWAFDLAHARFAWLWRGEFVDGAGTWNGRAGQLVKPKGEDHVVLNDFTIAGEPARETTGWSLDGDGNPVFAVRAGSAAYTDSAAPRLVAGGSEMVRTVTCREGVLELAWPAQEGVQVLVGGTPAPVVSRTAAGTTLQVVYRW